MKISTLFAAAALAAACMLAVAMPSVAASDLTTEPILGYEDIAYPAVCDLADVADVFTIAPAMTECTQPAAVSKPGHSFVLATLHAPASLFDLPIDFRIDPGRMAVALS